MALERVVAQLQGLEHRWLAVNWLQNNFSDHYISSSEGLLVSDSVTFMRVECSDGIERMLFEVDDITPLN